MSKHFEVVIKVAYEDCFCPGDMAEQLRKNVFKAADMGTLLSDDLDEAIVEEWDVDVEEI